MKGTTFLRGLLATAVLAASTAHGATIVSYEFDIRTEESGPLGSQTGNATFSFDDAIVPAGGGLVEGVDLIRSFSLVFDVGYVVGLPEPLVVTYTTLDYARLAFGLAGTVTGFVFSGDGFAVAYGLISEDQPSLFSNYATATVSYLQNAEVTYFSRLPTSVVEVDDGGTSGGGDGGAVEVPEPATLALFGFGLAGAIVARRRRIVRAA